MDPMQNQPVPSQQNPSVAPAPTPAPTPIPSPVTAPVAPQAPQMPQTPLPQPAPEKRSFGPIIGIAIVVAALIIGGLYFWGQKVAKEEQAPVDEGAGTVVEWPEQTTVPAEEQPLTSGDDIDSIEQDLSAEPVSDFDFSDLETGLGE